MIENEKLSQLTIEELEKLCKKNERVILEYNKFTHDIGIFALNLRRVHKLKK